MKSIRLAPAYDIVSTFIYESSTDEMALGIDGVYKIDDISGVNFEREARKVGLGVNMAMRLFDKMAAEFKSALLQSGDELRALGFVGVEEIVQKIIENFEKRSLG